MNAASESERPLVTAIVGCYNHAKYVHKALDSVKNQTDANIQLIVFDDCSKDNSAALIDEWIERNRYPCLFLRHSKNMGICRSFNDALTHAKGKFIAVLAADDAWLTHKTSAQLDEFRRAPENTAVVFSDALLMDADGGPIEGTFIPRFRKEPGPIPVDDLFADLWLRNYIPAMATLIRTDCIKAVGNYDEELVFEDWDMWLRLSHRFKFVFHSQPTAKYRILSTSMSHSRAEEMNRSTWLMKAKLAAAGMVPLSFRKEGAYLIVDAVEEKYKKGNPDCRELLRKSIALHPTARAAVMLLFANVGIPHQTYFRMRELWSRRPRRRKAST